MTEPIRRRSRRTRISSAEAAHEEPVQVPINWQGLDEQPVLMANQIFIRYIDGQVVLTFGQAVGPYSLRHSKEEVNRLQGEGVPVRAVARVSATPIPFRRMLAALNQIGGQLDEFLARDARHATDEGGEES